MRNLAHEVAEELAAIASELPYATGHAWPILPHALGAYSVEIKHELMGTTLGRIAVHPDGSVDGVVANVYT